MSKNFKKNVFSSLGEVSEEPQEYKAAPAAGDLDLEATKRKPGRPKTKTEVCKNINVAVPERLLNQWQEIRSVRCGNMTAYIIELIERDMANNYEKCKAAIEQLKGL